MFKKYLSITVCFPLLVGVISAGQIQTTQAYATGQTFGQLQVSRIPVQVEVQLEYDQAHTFSHVTLLT